MVEEPNGYRLSTGRTFAAHGGRLSVRRDRAGDFEICDGYDSVLLEVTSDDGDDKWTPAERREMAEYMIAEWTAFRDAQA